MTPREFRGEDRVMKAPVLAKLDQLGSEMPRMPSGHGDLSGVNGDGTIFSGEPTSSTQLPRQTVEPPTHH